MGRRSKETFLQRRHMDGQKTHEKMFNITHYSRNANQNHSGTTTSHQPEWPSSKSLQTIRLERVWRKWNPITLWWDCKLVQPLWKTVWRFLRKLNIELPFDPAIPLLGIYPEKTMTCQDTCAPMFIAALYTVAKTWKQPKCPLTEEWIKKM